MVYDDLHHFELFEGCSKKDLRLIRSITTPIRVEAGRELTTSGALGRECLLVRSGTVSITVDGYSVAEVGAGELVGEMALLDGPRGERNATAIATTDVDALVFTPAEFKTLLTHMPVVAQRVRDIAAAREARTAELV